MQSMLNSFRQKLDSIRQYKQIFENWWMAPILNSSRAIFHFNATLRFRDGRKLRLLNSEWGIAWENLILGAYRPVLSIQSPTLVWDVGGNIGCFVMWLSNYHPNAEFHSFEPVPATFRRLDINRQLNPKIHWTLHEFGVGAKDETCEAYIPKGNSFLASRFATEGVRTQFALKNANNYWEQMGRPRIDILKVDCEGGEYDLFLTATDDFLNSVGIIVMEVHEVPKQNPLELRSRLERAGFSVKWPSRLPAFAVASREALPVI
jgi:FkbM family methyltransferase